MVNSNRKKRQDNPEKKRQDNPEKKHQDNSEQTMLYATGSG